MDVGRDARLGRHRDSNLEEIAEAVRDGEFRIRHDQPGSLHLRVLHTGRARFGASGTGTALTGRDVRRVAPQLREFFAAQELTSGLSGWLADAFRQERQADGLFNYESVLLSLNDGRSAAEPVIHPVLPIYPGDRW